MGRFYKEYADFLAEHFPGRKMQKLTVDAGFSCPNRDGTISRGGCAYCNNASFSPTMEKAADAQGGGVSAQLEATKEFFSRKYPSMRYLAYFQSYTNTHGSTDRLLGLYDEALATDGVDGLIIGTRPDCLAPELLEALADRKRAGKWIMLELGAESSHNLTLERVNRCHTWEQTAEAVERVKRAGIPVGLHFIMGLPGESREMMLETVRSACALDLDTIKFHQLQIIRGSAFAALYDKGENPGWTLFTPEQYLSLCIEIIREMNSLSPATAIDRFTASAPPGLLLAPRWGLKNYQFVNLLNRQLQLARHITTGSR